MNTAELVDVGLANTNASSPTVRLVVVKAPRAGVARTTVKSAVTEMVSKLFAAACVAVIVAVPALTMVTRPVVALIGAISGLLEENFHSPLLLDVGA